MDLQKDEDFEKAWQENRHIWESTKNLAKAMFYAGQAKAQSNKKIKLLLCDEHLQKCESPTGIFNSQYPDEEPCLICLAKQAKARAIPDGFVLVSKEPNREFKDRLRSYLDNLWMGEWGCDWDGFICVNGIDPNEIWQFMIEAQEPDYD